ncbi:phosphoribosyltransferase-like protein [Erythrobacter sp. EC-HK427]|uniref:phosphoribosyltransferase-like protein n=1 Tax=Erythrobacter sp. EC-HK427 TaxID=2038396 RepID=UPI0012575300|nr:hypothetical protein [Erythrobacter sp. EC-HK427]VVT12400.1 conserved hypothetical protein [Erythrobacter sp. EC-HK427]
MAEAKIFVVTPAEYAASFRDRVVRDVIPCYRKNVVILEDEAFGIDNVTLAAKKVSDLIDDSGADREESHLLILRTTRTSHEKLRNRWEEGGSELANFYLQEKQRVLDKLDRILKKLGYHWRTYAETQLGKFLGQCTPLDKWCGQFFELDIGYLGRRIAMQLEVIGFDDGAQPFRPKSQDAYGLKLLHCYIDDGDHGGSWISVKDQLSHDLPEEAVHGIKFAEGQVIVPDAEFDEIVIYEDGLWSGSETIKRLRAIKATDLKTPIRLKFLVATDFGLLVVRQAIRELGLSGIVSVEAGEARLERFLSLALPDEEQFGRGIEPEEFFKGLHKHVVQGVFRTPQDWSEDIDDARAVAKDIGRQLVAHWFKKSRQDDDYLAGAEKFCLGGGGFASTLAFQRSVPKVCLPLLWLAGPVEVNGRKVEWRPLFLDARRVDPALLLAT